MKRIKNFGSLTINQQFHMLNSYLKKNEILLFQYYNESEIVDYEENIDDYFEDYCNDIIYYYNPLLKLKIDEEVIAILMKNIKFLGEGNELKKKEVASEVFVEMKKGNYEKVSKETLEIIKKLIFSKLLKYNIDEQFYNFVIERMYGSSQWIFDEHGKIENISGAIWYRPLDRDEYFKILKKFSMFSCISIEDGANINNFSCGYVVQEMEDDYDLLIFS